MKTAFLYDRVNKWGGAERTLLALHEVFPNAPLFTAVYSTENAPWAKVFPKVIPTFLQKIPFTKDKHELLGTFTPIAFENLDLTGFDLIISVTSEAAKGVIVQPPTKHICYCLTPTRYLWSGYDIYFRNPLLKLISKPVVDYLRVWDKIAAQRPDKMIAISHAVQKRIKKYYNRPSEVIFPPVELDFFKNNFSNKNGKEKREKFFLVVSRLVPYKMVDLAVSAFNELGLPLIIVGTGSEEEKLKNMAKSNIKFVGHLTDTKLADYYKKCAAFIFPQEEDFGIVALEAQAAGAPVIAYKAGGALDTVIEGKTGVFFDKQNKKSLIKAVKKFEKLSFNQKDLIKNAERFSKERFKREILRITKYG
ncbi:glycosyltransferase [Patescibacteria group bacterium]|nr:glycosyltransferase [Patescibacteria group bacterium]MBU0845666.1 glycosyltransferase [Patescibacteria group bacterium]MBU0923232.1 glycosyltransferase [Patescibacteria group bacterium]MBU1066941.1 glycosyltransferase [Patescibacteria group bacterium]MBU1844663.1 glycosyltransferase [Patescibacteria group bacterium]